MGHSGIVELLYRILPVPAWKSGLARHMENCPACSARLAGRDEVRRVLVQAEDLGGLDDVWPAVKRALGPVAGGGRPNAIPLSRPALKNKSVRPAPAVRWAAAGCGLVLAAALLVGTVRYLGHPGASGAGDSLAETSGFILHSARIENEPANTYIIHPQDDGMVIVWVEKNL
jgi:anti-sigma factor RsiW